MIIIGNSILDKIRLVWKNAARTAQQEIEKLEYHNKCMHELFNMRTLSVAVDIGHAVEMLSSAGAGAGKDCVELRLNWNTGLLPELPSHHVAIVLYRDGGKTQGEMIAALRARLVAAGLDPDAP